MHRRQQKKGLLMKQLTKGERAELAELKPKSLYQSPAVGSFYESESETWLVGQFRGHEFLVVF